MASGAFCLYPKALWSPAKYRQFALRNKVSLAIGLFQM